MVRLTYYGVRGSTPCCASELQGYGGNTSCVVLERAHEPSIILDMGTGLRQYGVDLCRQGVTAFEGTILLSHLHWDHVQGLPFFAPLHGPDAKVAIYGPRHSGGPLGELFCELMKPPFFPICPSDLQGDVRFFDCGGAELQLGSARVTSRSVPHTGETNGYRIEWGGVSIAYVPDHQQPIDDPTHVVPGVLELCADVDLLIHDAQFTPDEFAQRSDWGHCTVAYAVEVARQASAKRLVMFHHDPSHDDEYLDGLLEQARCMAAATGDGPKVSAAAEGTSFELGR